MQTELLNQLIISFILGGSLISVLSLLAEKLPPKFSGIVLSLPSTIILGYFFLGYGQSAVAVAQIVPASIPALGLAVLYPYIYVQIAKILTHTKSSKTLSTIISFILSAGFWLLAALPFIIFRHTSLLVGIMIYLLFVLAINFLLKRMKVQKTEAHHYGRKSLLIRALFVGTLISLVSLLAETMNPFWAGVIAMFPAGLASSMIVIHWNNDPRFLVSMVRMVPVGSITIAVYALSAMLAFPATGIYWGTLISLIASLITASSLAAIESRIARNRKED